MIRTALLTIAAVITAAQMLFALTGREIIQKSEDLPKPKTAKTKVDMTIHKGARVMEKEFLIYQKTIRGNDRVLFTFLKPTRIKVLTHTYDDREDDQWLRLSSGKIKRIVGSDKSKPFVQSHMTYEDLQSRSVNDYNYKKLGTAKVNGDTCYKVEARKIKGSETYDKTIMYVRTSDFFVLKIDFYRKGKLFKYLENKDVKKVDGILTPFTVSVTMANGSGKTVMKVKKLQYNSNIRDAIFAKEALR